MTQRYQKITSVYKYAVLLTRPENIRPRPQIIIPRPRPRPQVIRPRPRLLVIKPITEPMDNDLTQADKSS